MLDVYEKGVVNTLCSPLIQVSFYALPNGAIFLHKGGFYAKCCEEEAIEYMTVDGPGHGFVFEGHYGCLITKSQFDNYGLTIEDVRMTDGSDGQLKD